jgi:hypothetical protein
MHTGIGVYSTVEVARIIRVDKTTLLRWLYAGRNRLFHFGAVDMGNALRAIYAGSTKGPLRRKLAKLNGAATAFSCYHASQAAILGVSSP